VRYAGCLAPHSQLRGAILPTPRQQGVDEEKAKAGTPYCSWAQLLGRVFALDVATCPLCRRGALRIIAALTQESALTRIMPHLKLGCSTPGAGARGTPRSTGATTVRHGYCYGFEYLRSLRLQQLPLRGTIFGTWGLTNRI
jgi:hypothetical protein